MATWWYRNDVLCKAPELGDCYEITTVDRFAREYGWKNLPSVQDCPTVAVYVERMGLGQGNELSGEWGRRFRQEGFRMGWEYTPEADQCRRWMQERAELQGWNSLQVPSLKADCTERKAVVDAALELARAAREKTIVDLLSTMPSGVDCQKWMGYAAERVVPHDRMLIALRSLASALDGVGEPDQTVREDALSSIKLAKQRLATLDEHIDKFWKSKFLAFENKLREEKWGLSPVKKNNAKKKAPQEVTA